MKKFDFTVAVNEKTCANEKVLTVEQAKKKAIDSVQSELDYNGSNLTSLIRFLNYVEKNDTNSEIARVAGNYKKNMVGEKIGKIERKYCYIQKIVEQIKDMITFNLNIGEYTNIYAIQNQLMFYYQSTCYNKDPYSRTVATRTRIFYALNELEQEGILKQGIAKIDGNKYPSKIWKRIK